VHTETWNDVFKKLLENRVILDKVTTLQNDEETSDDFKSAVLDLSERDFPDLYKFLSEKKDLAVSVLYNKTEIKVARIVYKLVERRRGRLSESYYFPAFDHSKEPPAGFITALTSSQDKLLSQIETQVIEFISSGLAELHLPPANSYIRRFEHQIASKFGLNSSSQGEDRDRHVVIYKGKLS
jgi:hypothetical protein